MALEDLAMFQSLPGCTVFYPSDAVAMERAVELAASTRGITFLRAGRPQVSSLALTDFINTEHRRCRWSTPMMSSSRLARLRSCVKPRAIRFLQNLEHVSTFLLKKVLVVAAGITLFEALKAADALAAAGVKVLNGLFI